MWSPLWKIDRLVAIPNARKQYRVDRCTTVRRRRRKGTCDIGQSASLPNVHAPDVSGRSEPRGWVCLAGFGTKNLDRDSYVRPVPAPSTNSVLSLSKLWTLIWGMSISADLRRRLTRSVAQLAAMSVHPTRGVNLAKALVLQ